MIQKIISGGWYSFWLAANSFTAPHGGRAWTAITPNYASFSIVAVAGTLRKFRVRLRRSDGILFAPAVGESYTLTIRKDEVNTVLQVVLTDASYDATDMANEVALVAGERVDIKCEPGGGPITDRYPLWSFEFEPTNPKESVYFVTGGVWYKNMPEGFFTLTPNAANPYDNSESEVQQIVAAPGKIKSLYLELSDNPGAGADAYRMTLMVNGAPTALTVTITGEDTSGSDLVSEVPVVAGDLVCWKKEAIDLPANNLNVRAGFAFEADTDGESLFVNGSKTALDTAAVEYRPLSHNIRAWTVDEFEQWQYAQALTVKKFYVRVSAAPGAGKSWTFRVRKNGVDTDIVVTISESDTDGSDLVNTVNVSDDDYLDVSCAPSGTPAAAAAYWGAVQSPAEAAGGAASSNAAAKLVAAGLI